jgi:hypothetical protein
MINRNSLHRLFDDPMKLLIAYDGSTYAESAIDDLRRAALPEKCEAIVISVAETWLSPIPASGRTM